MLQHFPIEYSAVTWAMDSNSLSCSESTTELLKLVYQSHTNSAQNSVDKSLQAPLQETCYCKGSSTFRETAAILGHFP